MYFFNIVRHHIILIFNTTTANIKFFFCEVLQKSLRVEWTVIILKPFTLKCMCTLQTWTLEPSHWLRHKASQGWRARQSGSCTFYVRDFTGLLLFGLPKGWLGVLPDCALRQTSWLRHSFIQHPPYLWHIIWRPKFLVQNSLFNTTTTLDNVTFRIFDLSY